MLPPFVTALWWQEHRDEVVLVDVRGGVDGQRRYEAGHLAGAVLVELDRWLASPASPEHGRHPLPSTAVFAEGLARAGVGDGTEVVAYDDVDGVFAARLVWMLRVTGRSAALLDGGLRAGGPGLECTPTTRPRAQATVVPWPAAALAEASDVAAAGRAASGGVVLDARPRARYLGAPDALDPRPGHVPGARSLPCRDNLDGSGRLLPADVLRQRLLDAGVAWDTPVVSMCGSGVTACHTLLVLEHVGLGHGRLYPGSWSQWASDPARPVALA